MRIRNFALLAALCFLGHVGNAFAAPGEATEPGLTSCNLDSYISIGDTPNVAIPDGSPLVLGPINFPHQAGVTIQDVVVALEIQHPSVGDLIVSLMRVHASEIVTVELLDRPSYPEIALGCQAELRPRIPEALWHFGDDGAHPMAEGEHCLPDGQPVPAGCYQVAPESASPLAVFDGLEIGGAAWDPARWYLIVTDDHAGQTGHLTHWSVHVTDQSPVPVENRSWGVVKSRYR